MAAGIWQVAALSSLLMWTLTAESNGEDQTNAGATPTDVACMRLAGAAQMKKLEEMEPSERTDFTDQCNKNPDQGFCEATAIILRIEGYSSEGLTCGK